MKYAKAICPDRRKATGRVKSPSNSRPPPNASRIPDAPRRVMSSKGTTGAPATSGKPSNFCVPWMMYKKATMMRRMLNRRGDQAEVNESSAGMLFLSVLILEL